MKIEDNDYTLRYDNDVWVDVLDQTGKEQRMQRALFTKTCFRH